MDGRTQPFIEMRGRIKKLFKYGLDQKRHIVAVVTDGTSIKHHEKDGQTHGNKTLTLTLT